MAMIRLSASRVFVQSLKLGVLFCLLVLSAQIPGQDRTSKERKLKLAAPGQIRIPSRAPAPLFKGQQGKQKTEIRYDPATHIVTIKLLVQDPNGYFIPNIRRDNFAVYENGVRQQNLSVDIEHAPVSLGMLLESGGRSQSLNRVVAEEVSAAGRQLLDEVGPEDRVAIWKYSDKVQKIADFTQNRDALKNLFYAVSAPGLSEANLYDTVIYAVDQMRSVPGRKALILISSGVDTFSKARFEDALKAAQSSDAPIYAIALTRIVRDTAEVPEPTAPAARIDWNKAERDVQEIARVSGGRAYSPESTVHLSPIYDDMMENLKVRYVITYRSSNDADLNSPRTVRVELVDERTGGPLQIMDANGRRIRAKIIVQESYSPSAASTTLQKTRSALPVW